MLVPIGIIRPLYTTPCEYHTILELHVVLFLLGFFVQCRAPIKKPLVDKI